MNLIKYNPFGAIARRTVFGDLFGDALETFLGGVEWTAAENFVPAVDVKETDKEYMIEAELPGIKKEDVHIEVKDHVLTLRGERKFENEEKKEDYTRIERSYGTFLRTFGLPEHVAETGIEAAYKDGILTIRLPKGEAPKPKEIEVKLQ